MKSAVTISLVRESAGGPFVFWHDLEGGMREAAALGFDAVEIFPPAPEVVNHADVGDLLSRSSVRPISSDLADRRRWPMASAAAS